MINAILYGMRYKIASVSHFKLKLFFNHASLDVLGSAAIRLTEVR